MVGLVEGRERNPRGSFFSPACAPGLEGGESGAVQARRRRPGGLGLDRGAPARNLAHRQARGPVDLEDPSAGGGREGCGGGGALRTAGEGGDT
jgi:hypothetical protein